MLRPMKREWAMEFASSAGEALRTLATHPFDVVVTDMRMPGMDGADLLLEVKSRYPRIARIVLSGQTEQKSALRSVAGAHRFLAKPCDPETLKKAIDGVCELRELLANEALLSAVTGLEKLPSLPDNYMALMREARSPNASAHTVARIVTRDFAMSAKVLQLVNSAFFGLAREIIDVDRAVALLGTETISSLLLSRAVFDCFSSASAGLASLWTESLLAGRAARLLADCEDASPHVKQAAYEAGLMHDIGRLVLATTAPGEVEAAARLAAEQQLAFHDAETRVLGCDHGVVGAYLLDLWGLPTSIIEVVAYHHRPAASSVDSFGPLVAVHAANGLLAETGGAAVSGLDHDWLARLELSDRLPEWRDRVGALRAELAS